MVVTLKDKKILKQKFGGRPNSTFSPDAYKLRLIEEYEISSVSSSRVIVFLLIFLTLCIQSFYQIRISNKTLCHTLLTGPLNL